MTSLLQSLVTGGERWAVGGLLGLGLGLRVAVALMCQTISKDGTSLLRLAWGLGHGDGSGRHDWQSVLEHSQHPLTAMMLAVPAALGAPLLPSAIAIMTALSALTLVPVWILARDIAGTRAGLVALFIAACGGLWLQLSATIVTEPLYILCFATCAAAGWRAVSRGSIASHALFGVSGALAYLTRPEGLLLPTVIAAFLSWKLIFVPAERRRRLLGCLVGGLLATLCIGPYVAYLSHAEGRLLFTRKKTTRVEVPLYAAEVRALDRLRAEAGPPAEVALPAAPPRRRLAFLNDLQESVVGAFEPALAVLAFGTPLAGLILCWGRRRTPGGGWLAHLFVGSALAVYLGVFAWHLWEHGYLASRQVSPMMVPLLPWAAVGTLALSRALGRGRRGELCVLLLILATVASFQLYRGLRRHGSDKGHELAAAQVLRADPELAPRLCPPGELSEAAPMAMSTLPLVAFYAGARLIAPPKFEHWYREEEWRELVREALDASEADLLILARSDLVHFEWLPGSDGRITSLGSVAARRPVDDVLLYRVRK